MSDYSIVRADDAEDAYADTDVPGEFRSLKEALEAEQIAVTLIRVPPHSDFEQGTGHFHEELEEIYIITSGTLTMRFEDEVEEVTAGSAVRVAPGTTRSHRNEARSQSKCGLCLVRPKARTRPRSRTSGRPHRAPGETRPRIIRPKGGTRGRWFTANVAAADFTRRGR